VPQKFRAAAKHPKTSQCQAERVTIDEARTVRSAERESFDSSARPNWRKKSLGTLKRSALFAIFRSLLSLTTMHDSVCCGIDETRVA
jgi:hypothetical protein